METDRTSPATREAQMTRVLALDRVAFTSLIGHEGCRALLEAAEAGYAAQSAVAEEERLALARAAR